MDKIWNELLQFETHDLVKDYMVRKHNREPNERKIHQINANFIQGREYFVSAKLANAAVRPLLQYYGIMSISKGLILCLEPMRTEDSLKGAHGLKINNWKEVVANRDFENLQIIVESGTFSELLTATKNKNYLRANSTNINFSSLLNIPPAGSSVTLKEIIHYFPDLENEYYAWLTSKLLYCVITNVTRDDKNNSVKIQLQGVKDPNELECHFPETYCISKKLSVDNHNHVIEYANLNWSPNVTQRWSGHFGIGDACIVPVLRDDIGINILGSMYMISYVFGMMARYYPSVWIDIHRGRIGDKIFPFANQIFDFINERFPLQVLDFLKSPYGFENRKLTES